MKFEINGEFGYELALAVPLVYYHYLKTGNIETHNTRDTQGLYFFSPNHYEYDMRRDMFLEVKIDGNHYYRRHHHSADFYHVNNFNVDQWIPPPYGAFFKNDYFKFEKPIYLISNKYNSEWGGDPVNYLDLDTLDQLFTLLSNDYQVIYNRATPKNIVEDNSATYDLGDFKLIEDKYKSKVLTIQELVPPSTTFNITQMMVHANSNNFISVQGGNAVFSSYFGGSNIVFAKEGGELQSGAFDKWYKNFSGCEVKHTDNYSTLVDLVKQTI